MEIKLSKEIENIEYGDVVLFKGYLCLVVHDMKSIDFPCRLLRLGNSSLVRGYYNLECLRASKEADLYLKSSEIIISNKQK